MLPVKVVSAYNKVEFVRKALRLNVINYLDKPVDPNELEITVKKSFNGKLSHEHVGSEFKISLNTVMGTMFVAPEKLLYFCSNKRSSIACFADEEKKVMVKENLMSLEKSLPNDIFKRVSRQYIIDVKYLVLIKKELKQLTLHANKREVKLAKIYPKIIDE